MPFTFPQNPAVGDAYAAGGNSWMWNAQNYWERGVGLVKPFLTALVPTEGPTNDATINVRVLGGNFHAGSVVQWDGVAVATTFVSSSELTCTAPSAPLAKISTVDVLQDVVMTSNPLEFTYIQPSPYIMSLIPNTAPTGMTMAVQVNGSNFTSNSEVIFDGVVMPTTFVSVTELGFTAPSRSVASAEVVTIRDGVLISNSMPFNYLLQTMRLEAIVPNNAPHAQTSQVEVHFTGWGFINGLQIIMTPWNVQPANFVNSGDIWTLVFPSSMSGGTPVPPDPSVPKPGVFQCYLWNQTTGEVTNSLPFTWT